MAQPHVQSITMFDVERIVFTTDPNNRCQTITFEGADGIGAVSVHAWRGWGDQENPPEIFAAPSRSRTMTHEPQD